MPQLKRTEEVNNFLELSKFLYDKSPVMKGKPSCKLYYITTGNWLKDTNLLAVINTGIQEIKSTNLFKDVVFEPCDANTIQKYYNKTKEIVNATFYFKERLSADRCAQLIKSDFSSASKRAHLCIIL